MSHLEELQEFEEQIRLQSSKVIENEKKTRVDLDGSIMEWDETRKAWFPKIDDDFIARYQMSYGVNTNPQPTQNDNLSSAGMDWNNFNSKLAHLRAEKGEDCEEVQQLTKAANDALQSYYNSPAYREWYENYCKQQQPKENQSLKQSGCVSNSTAFVIGKNRKNLLNNRNIVDSKTKRKLTIFHESSEDTDLALARAEEELKSGDFLTIDSAQDNSKQDCAESGNATGTNLQSEQPTIQKRKQSIPPPAWYEIDESKNTHVYVSGLPPTITDEQFENLMSKCGLIMNEPFGNKLRIKLYRDQTGKPKGDGRCCYIKVESVELALNILDGMTYEPDYVIHVERAKFQPKGEFDPLKRRRLTVKEKKKLKEQQENLFRWGIDTSKFIRSKKERVIVLKNAFYEPDLKRDVTLIPLLRERIRVQCVKCGAIKKIVVHDANPNGVVTVTFCTPEEADTGLNFLDNTLFDYPGPGGVRQLSAERWDGKTNYSVKESKDDEEERIQNWEEFLGGEPSSDEDDSNKEENGSDLNESKKPEIDYWDDLRNEENSPLDQMDTDEDNGSSGADTP